MASVELATLFPPDIDAAVELLERCFPNVAIVAEEKLFGHGVGGEPRAIAAHVDDELVGLSVVSGEYVRFLVVDPSVRAIGVGNALLDESVADVARGGNRRVRLTAEPGNYTNPGIDRSDTKTIEWFKARGFAITGENTNLVVDIANNQQVTEERLFQLVSRSQARGYTLSRASSSAEERDEIVTFAAGYTKSWGIEVARALIGPPGAVHLARAEGELVAFAAHDGNNRGLGWFGPAATAHAHRGKGLGEALLIACLCDVAAAGHDQTIIPWIGPRDFYERAVGVQSELHFVTMEKNL